MNIYKYLPNSISSIILSLIFSLFVALTLLGYVCTFLYFSKTLPNPLIRFQVSLEDTIKSHQVSLQVPSDRSYCAAPRSPDGDLGHYLRSRSSRCDAIVLRSSWVIFRYYAMVSPLSNRKVENY